MTERATSEPPGRLSETALKSNGAVSVARRFLSVTTALFWKSLARSAAFTVLASLALSSLGMILPTFRYFETSTYANADFTYEVDHLLTNEAEAALIGIAANDDYVSFTRFSNVEFSARGRSHGRVEMLLTTKPEKIGLSWFSEKLTVDSCSVQGSRWLDISAHLAKALQAQPGDGIDISIGTTIYRPIVRRVLAVRYSTNEYVAVGPMPSTEELGFASATPFLPTIATLTTDKSAGDIQALLAGFPKGDSALVSSTAKLRAQSEANATFSYRVIVTISLLAYLAVIVLAIREATALVRRNAGSMMLLQVLGVRRRRLIWAITLAETLAVSVGVGVGCYWCAKIIYDGILFPVMPPGYTKLLASAGILGVMLFALVAWMTLTRRTWRWSSRTPFPTELR